MTSEVFLSKDAIVRRIVREGPLTVAAFMREVLFHPQYGYYTTHIPIGRCGSYTTAPEMSQIFGELLAGWCMEMWTLSGKPSMFRLVELGPGRATLIQDILRIASSFPNFRQAMKIHLIENSPRLRQLQQQRLQGEQVLWHEHFTDVPDGWTIVLANEFFDCLPLHQLQKTKNGWCERLVATSREQNLCFMVQPYPSPLGLFTTLPEADLGSIVELSPIREAYLRDIVERLLNCGGVFLMFDYGYESPPLRSTLQRIESHHSVPVLEMLHYGDLSGQVDFGHLVRTVQTTKGVSYGPLAQGQFLQTLGIQERARLLRQNAQPHQKQDIQTALFRLTDATQMGTLFKVLAVTPPGGVAPIGFH